MTLLLTLQSYLIVRNFYIFFTSTNASLAAENPWYVVMSSPWQFVWIGNIQPFRKALCANYIIAFMVAFSVVNVVLAVIKIVQFVRAYGGCKHAIVFYVLPIEIFSNISM